jgi:hypothetical protein
MDEISPWTRPYQITEQAVTDALGGIPEYKMRCSNLARAAIRNSIDDWRQRTECANVSLIFCVICKIFLTAFDPSAWQDYKVVEFVSPPFAFRQHLKPGWEVVEDDPAGL